MSELPHGTVTLLFSDVEGSTQLQHRLGERYQDVVAITAVCSRRHSPSTVARSSTARPSPSSSPSRGPVTRSRPRYNREIERIDRLTGEARRRAWSDLDAEMIRNDPPWAPFMNGAQRDFISKSFGCYVFQPVIGRLDIAAACKK